MAGYLKRIAVIKQVKGGFSADGGVLSGFVKAETYAGYLKAEVSLVNFAPLAEGRYVFGISDGVTSVVFEDLSFECESDMDCSHGFGFLVCFCKDRAYPIASAYCGQGASALPQLTQKIQQAEEVKAQKNEGIAYDDEAIAEENYYERKVDKIGGTVCKATPQNGDGLYQKITGTSGENAENLRTVAGTQDRVINQNEVAERSEDDGVNRTDDGVGGLAGGDFYSRIRGDVEKIFAEYPHEEELEKVIEGSRFVKIAYGRNAYYVFGVLTSNGKPAYVCYGVPSLNALQPPKSLKGFSSYIPCRKGGYWMTYQDARTGVSVGIELT